MGLEDLSQELQEKAKACQSVDELKSLCEAVGVKLTDEEIEGIAGGGDKTICRAFKPCSKHGTCPGHSACRKVMK